MGYLLAFIAGCMCGVPLGALVLGACAAAKYGERS